MLNIKQEHLNTCLNGIKWRCFICRFALNVIGVVRVMYFVLQKSHIGSKVIHYELTQSWKTVQWNILIQKIGYFVEFICA